MVQSKKLTSALLILVVAGFCSVLFTWPLIVSPNGIIISRQFDVYVLSWMLHITPEMNDLHTSLSNWPVGQSLNRTDSLLMMILAFVVQGHLNPWTLISLTSILGVASSIWAAEKFARVVGKVDAPYSYFCGIQYGLSGVALVTLLEGPLYLLIIPWLPLMATQLWLFIQAPSKVRILLVSIYWTLSLLTSAYLGLTATLTVLWMVGWHLYTTSSSTPKIRDWLQLFTTLLLLGMSYVLLFFAQGEATRTLDNNTLDTGSITLSNALTWSPKTDLVFHSNGPVIGVFALAALAFAPFLCSGKSWKSWWGLAVLSIGLSFGRHIGMLEEGWKLPWLLFPLFQTDIGSFIRFPLRFFWIGSLCCGYLLSQIIFHLKHRRQLFAAVAGMLMLFEIFVINGTFFRTTRTPIHTPEIYHKTSKDRAIFELYPNINPLTGIEPLYFKNVLCAYQIDHKRPIAPACMGTTVSHGTDWILRNQLFDDVLGQQRLDWRERLQNMGFGAIMFHPTLFQATDRKTLRDYLIKTLGEPDAVETSSEHLLLWNLEVNTQEDYKNRYLEYTSEFQNSDHYLNSD